MIVLAWAVVAVAWIVGLVATDVLLLLDTEDNKLTDDMLAVYVFNVIIWPGVLLTYALPFAIARTVRARARRRREAKPGPLDVD